MNTHEEDDRDHEQRLAQVDAFFKDFRDRIRRVAKQFGVTQYYDTWLLPDGYECPGDEAYEELLNALQAWEEMADMENL